MDSTLITKRFTRRNFLYASGAVAASFAMGGIMTACSSGNTDNAGNASGNAESNAANSSNAANNSSSNAATGNSANTGAGSKILVAYYSAQGHTAKVAEAAAKELGADLFEVVPSELYSDADLNWNDSESRVSREHDSESLRTIELNQTTPSDWQNYDMVLLGYPIWWGIAAWPINGFVKDNDFTGKSVVPFCTSASSGLGESAILLEQAAGTGTWQDGMRFSSGASVDEVSSWVHTI